MSKTSTKTKTNTKTIAKRPAAAMTRISPKDQAGNKASKAPGKSDSKTIAATATPVAAKLSRAAKPTRTATPAVVPTSTAAPRVSKVTLIENLARRAEGAILADLMAATGWQQHSVRAALSGLRKAGHSLLRDRNAEGESRYRIGEAS